MDPSLSRSLCGRNRFLGHLHRQLNSCFSVSPALLPYPKVLSIMKISKLFFAGSLTVLMGASCVKYTPIPFPGPIPIQLPQTPFMTWLDSVTKLAPDTDITVNPVGLIDPDSKAGGPGQAEIGFAFRSSVPGTVALLGVFLPAPGYQHTVTLWDSATGTVLAQTNVPTIDTATWNYVDLYLTGQEASIAADHGYIVGFNSLAVGSSINTNSPGNLVTDLFGFYIFSPSGANGTIPVLPFTEGAITYEGSYYYPYESAISAPIFPGSLGPAQGGMGVFGVCDIGFIPGSH
jgi:hypothetical protein